MADYSYKYLTTMLMPHSCYHVGPNGFSIYLYKRETCDTITIFVHYLFSIIYASSVVADYSYKYLTTMLMPHSCYHVGPNGLFDLLI